ncbi:MAG: hypothetical protein JW787_01080 [Sedimentisphaerales bacterium]|nr:hypothetical protein [Sedimentisphaerales bacterium]
MKTLTKNLILFALSILFFCQYIYAQQIEPPKRDFEYIISDEYEVLDPSIKENLIDTLPTHVAILKIPLSRPDFSSRMNNDIIETIQIPARPFPLALYRCIYKGDNSSKKLEFMFFCNPTFRPSQGIVFYIFANSEQQARQFTELFIKGYDIGTYNSLKQLKYEQEYYQEIIRNGKTVISKMEADYNEMEEQKNKLYKEYAKTNYLSDGTIPEVNDIIKVKDELAHSLRGIDFELVGLDAKIESINKYKLSLKIIDDETLIKLNQILMATDIERAGVLARKQAFETSFKQTTQLYDLILNSKKAFVDLEKYKNKFKYAPETVSNLEMNLKNPRDQYRYIEIEDNKVTIKPVKQD